MTNRVSAVIKGARSVIVMILHNGPCHRRGLILFYFFKT